MVQQMIQNLKDVHTFFKIPATIELLFTIKEMTLWQLIQNHIYALVSCASSVSAGQVRSDASVSNFRDASHSYTMSENDTSEFAYFTLLSVVGVLMILYTHIAFRRYRSKAREIIVHISLMDLTVALANFIGIVVDFESMLYPYFDGGTYDVLHPVHDLPTSKYRAINSLCITQAAFAVYGTICSVLWTASLVVYFYFTILGDNAKITKRIYYSFYVICYGLPALVVIWLGTTGKIGYIHQLDRSLHSLPWL